MPAFEEVVGRLNIRVRVHDLAIESRSLGWRIS